MIEYENLMWASRVKVGFSPHRLRRAPFELRTASRRDVPSYLGIYILFSSKHFSKPANKFWSLRSHVCSRVLQVEYRSLHSCHRAGWAMQFPPLLISTLIFLVGTWQAKPGEVGKAVLHALKVGYRHLDCALIYQNGSSYNQSQFITCL